MALRREVVDFVRLYLLDDVSQAGGVGHVAVMQEKWLALFVHVMEQVVDPPCVEQGTAALDAVHLVAFAQQQFCEIRTILSCNTGD
jgi:hypothetical protein